MKVEDPIVEQVVEKLRNRSAVGIKKYNTTLQSNNTDNFLLHLQLELADAVNYIEKLLTQKEDLIQLVKKFPNDAELGKEIRKFVK